MHRDLKRPQARFDSQPVDDFSYEADALPSKPPRLDKETNKILYRLLSNFTLTISSYTAKDLERWKG